MTIAFAIWEDRISPVFDTAGRLMLGEVEGGCLVNRRFEAIESVWPAEKVTRLRALGVEVLVCGAISHPLAAMIAAEGIALVPFVAGEVEQVIAAYLRGDLVRPAFAMPGCVGRCRGRFGRGRGRGGGGRGRGGGRGAAGPAFGG